MGRGENRPAGGYSVSGAGATPSSGSPSSSAIEALATEAMAFDGGKNEESIDVKVQKALECPCLDDLKKGPCGSPFIDAFPAISRAPKKRRDQTVSTLSLPSNIASKKTRRHLSRRFWRKRKTTTKLISLTPKFFLQHGPENPNQRNEVYEIGWITIPTVITMSFPPYSWENSPVWSTSDQKNEENSDEEIRANLVQLFHKYCCSS